MENNTHLQLKKIKRPINRMAPQANQQPTQALYKESQKSADTPSVAVDVDRYLDEPALPIKEVKKQDYSKAQEVSPEYLDETTYEREVYDIPERTTPEWLSVKLLIVISCMAVFVGIVIGKLIFSEEKVVRNGLQGVVVNNEVPRGRARCGVAERAQGCVLYLMNPQRQEMRAKDFYDFAAQMTGRQRFMIETGNMRYANSKIRPGDIAQLNIPPL